MKWEKDGCSIDLYEDGKKIGNSEFMVIDAQNAELLDPTCKFPEHNIREIKFYNKWKKQTETKQGCNCKENWKRYPRNMFFNRAISNGVRTYCPDVLGNAPVYDPDELGASTDELGRVTELPASAIPAVQQLPQGSDEVPAPAYDEEAAANAVDSAAPQDDRGDNPLQLISDELEGRGIEDKAQRGIIALKIAGVASFNEISKNQWFEVYDAIVDMDDETLGTFGEEIAEDEPEVQTAPPAKPDEVVEVTDETMEAAKQGTLLDDVEGVFGPGVEDMTAKSDPGTSPEPKKSGTIAKPTGRQIAKVKSLFIKKKLKEDEQQQAFAMEAIGKNYAVTPEDFDKLIAALEK